jgi:hypothetical protein
VFIYFIITNLVLFTLSTLKCYSFNSAQLLHLWDPETLILLAIRTSDYIKGLQMTMYS